MLVVLSTGRILNLSQVAWIDPPESGGIKIRTASGHHDICSRATKRDYEQIVQMLKLQSLRFMPTSKDANAQSENKNADGDKKRTRAGAAQ